MYRSRSKELSPYNGAKDMYHCTLKEVNTGVSDRHLSLMCIAKSEYTYSRLCFKQITDSKTCVLLKGQTPRNPSLVSRRENLYRVLIHAQVLKRAHISCSRSVGDHHVHREWISVLILFISLYLNPGSSDENLASPLPRHGL